VFRGERFPNGELHHGIGKGESKAAQHLSGWLGSQEGIELVLAPLIVEAKEPVAPRDMDLRHMQLQLLKHLDNHVEAGGVERLDNGGSLCQLSLHHDDEVYAPKAHVHARDPADARD